MENNYELSLILVLPVFHSTQPLGRLWLACLILFSKQQLSDNAIGEVLLTSVGVATGKTHRFLLIYNAKLLVLMETSRCLNSAIAGGSHHRTGVANGARGYWQQAFHLALGCPYETLNRVPNVHLLTSSNSQLRVKLCSKSRNSGETVWTRKTCNKGIHWSFLGRLFNLFWFFFFNSVHPIEESYFASFSFFFFRWQRDQTVFENLSICSICSLFCSYHHQGRETVWLVELNPFRGHHGCHWTKQI